MLALSVGSSPRLLARRVPHAAGRLPNPQRQGSKRAKGVRSSQRLQTAALQWTRSKKSGRDLAVAKYRAALDREEKAACVCELIAAQLEDRVDE